MIIPNILHSVLLFKFDILKRITRNYSLPNCYIPVLIVTHLLIVARKTGLVESVDDDADDEEDDQVAEASGRRFVEVT